MSRADPVRTELPHLGHAAECSRQPHRRAADRREDGRQRQRPHQHQLLLGRADGVGDGRARARRRRRPGSRTPSDRCQSWVTSRVSNTYNAAAPGRDSCHAGGRRALVPIWTGRPRSRWWRGFAPGTRTRSRPCTRPIHARLFNFLARLSRRRDVAEDLLEETWLRLIAHAQPPRAGHAPRAVALHRRPQPVLQLLPVAGDGRGIGCGPDRAVAGGHAAAVAVRGGGGARSWSAASSAALAGLPATYREVLLLVGVEGLSPSEAARVCGVSPEALRQRLSRARDHAHARTRAGARRRAVAARRR